MIRRWICCGSLVELGDLGVAHHPLDRIFGDVAVSAQDLDRIGGDPHGGVAGDELGAAGPVREVRCIGVHPGRGSIGELPGGLRLAGHVGQHELDPLEVDHALVELLPVGGVPRRLVDGALGDAHRLRRNAQP